MKFTVAGLAGIALIVGLLLLWPISHKDASPKQFFTIYVLGGSTSRGFPYDPQASFGELVKLAYGGKIDGRPVKVVNLAESGMPIHWVEDSLSKVGSDADLVFLYSGNNEFLEFDRDHDLSTNARSLFDQPIVSEEKRQDIYNRYEKSLQHIVDFFKERKVPLFLFTVAVNWADWEPNRSVLTDNSHADSVNKLFQKGNRLFGDGNFQAALAAFQKIIALEPQFAYAHMKIGDSYRALKKFKLAREHYLKAADFDMNPYRVSSRQNLYIKQTAATAGLPLIDLVALLENASTDGLIGFNWMWDNCHPTLEGYRLIAGEIARVMQEKLHLKESWDLPDMAEFAAGLGITDDYRLRVAGGRGQYCYVSSTQIFDPRKRLERAQYYLKMVEKVTPEDPDLICGLAVLSMLNGNLAEAKIFWKKAYLLDPEMTKQRLEHPRVEEILRRWKINEPLSLVQ